MSRATSLLSPSRGIARLFFAGRGGALGPPRVGAFLEEPQLLRMFQTIGGTYDMQNRILSLGRDAGWRKTLTEKVRGKDGETVVDMATGTGEVAISLARRYPGIRVVGVDFSTRMLHEARRKVAALPPDTARRIELRHGDIRGTDVGRSTADVVTNVFALRNIPERTPVLAEFRRVLKPGGRLFIMETTVPSAPAIHHLYGAWLSVIMPFLGNVLSRTDYAYSYLKHSIESFPETPAFLAELAAAGFTRPRAAALSFGIAVLFSAIRGDDG